MTYMPRFIHPATKEHVGNSTEVELLIKRSQEGLLDVLAKRDLLAKKAPYESRLEAELSIIIDKQFTSYFLIVADYVNWARENNIAVGPGRGSGPCSLVGYALGITSVDPIKYDLPFERFVNPDRASLPDFDLEFCDNRRDEVTKYLQLKYGADRVAQISSDESIPLPSRLVICDRPVAEVVPINSKQTLEFPATNMTVAQVSDSGLVQFNVINQKALTIIQHVVYKLKQSGTTIDIENIPLNDPEAYRLLAAGEESNLDLLDCDHYKATLVAIQPGEFKHLYAAVALSYWKLHEPVTLYAKRKHNSKSAQYFHPMLEGITGETYGQILYQEQIMRIAHEIAGFSFAQSDLFRRKLKSSNKVATEFYRKKFISGATSRGLPHDEATDLFEYVRVSNQHSFNKSHAIAYALIAYQTAWLKANYAQEYANTLSLSSLHYS